MGIVSKTSGKIVAGAVIGDAGAADASITTLSRTGNQALDASGNSYWSIQPNGNLTLTITGGFTGQKITILVEQLHTTSRTVTFGSGFKPTGTLATGTTASRMFVMSFVHDGTNFYETSRTAAITVS